MIALYLLGPLIAATVVTSVLYVHRWRVARRYTTIIAWHNFGVRRRFLEDDGSLRTRCRDAMRLQDNPMNARGGDA